MVLADECVGHRIPTSLTLLGDAKLFPKVFAVVFSSTKSEYSIGRLHHVLANS